jgi:hypothetical protein
MMYVEDRWNNESTNCMTIHYNRHAIIIHDITAREGRKDWWSIITAKNSCVSSSVQPSCALQYRIVNPVHILVVQSWVGNATVNDDRIHGKNPATNIHRHTTDDNIALHVYYHHTYQFVAIRWLLSWIWIWMWRSAQRVIDVPRRRNNNRKCDDILYYIVVYSLFHSLLLAHNRIVMSFGVCGYDYANTRPNDRWLAWCRESTTSTDEQMMSHG